ncbi:hypothetical protein [Ideonella oryzae]|uniref:NnrS family protein n=1 Tax=Ideonella oryzae TaxID=2937441 RepID=A0ABT1BSR5_9BURK|nr:hypothetical protein [Ideonella oryzae]MCO5978581.1 hypothetical protein [Ideonella oryzae]
MPSTRLQLWLYLPSVLVLMAVLGDQGLLQGAGLAHSPATVAGWPWYGLVFGQPHIMGSGLLFLDGALRRPCQPLLQRAAVLAALACTLALWLPEAWRDGLLIGWTLWHVVGQQAGLACGQARVASTAGARAWKVTLALGTGVAAWAVGGETLQSPQPDGPWLLWAGWALSASVLPASWLLWQARRRGGDVRALLALQATALLAYGCVLLGYAVFGVMLLRWTHDATAFAAYLAVVRQRRGRLAAAAFIPLSLLLSLATSALLPGAVLLWMVLVHYLAEPALWRAGSPLRRTLQPA